MKPVELTMRDHVQLRTLYYSTETVGTIAVPTLHLGIYSNKALRPQGAEVVYSKVVSSTQGTYKQYEYDNLRILYMHAYRVYMADYYRYGESRCCLFHMPPCALRALLQRQIAPPAGVSLRERVERVIRYARRYPLRTKLPHPATVYSFYEAVIAGVPVGAPGQLAYVGKHKQLLEGLCVGMLQYEGADFVT